MEHIKNAILDIIEKNYNTFKGTNEAELHSSEDITEMIYDISIKFANWLAKKFNIGYDNGKHFYIDVNGEGLDTKELFDYFINNVYEK